MWISMLFIDVNGHFMLGCYWPSHTLKTSSDDFNV